MLRKASITFGLAGLLAVGAVILFLIADARYPPDLSRLESLSREVVDSDGRRLRAYLSADQMRRLPVRLAAVDRRYLDLLIAFEDRRYWHHAGVDPLALTRAAWQALWNGRVVSGASTLTMQAARLLEPRRRGLRAKLIEMFRALQLERRFSKREILEIYMTLAPFGGNLEGVTAASWRYFKRAPDQLTLDQAALLVALPQSPTRLHPARHPDAARAARDKVLDRVAQAGLVSPEALARAKAESVLKPGPARAMTAAHLADRLIARHDDQAVIRTSLNGDLQRRWEAMARDWARQLGPTVSVAILAVRNNDRQALAYVGSADFGARDSAGQVDVVPALRSPGSTLKPILYGLAFERGIAHPATEVDDMPTQFGNYAPSNFMDRHYGRVTLTEALRRSLNVPAVALLDRLGPRSVAERLRRAGIALSFGGETVEPGLAFALGGVGVSLEDLVALYVALADDGRPRPIGYLASGAPPPSTEPPLIGETARWYIGEILRGARPPDSLLPDRYRTRSRALAFKTGTSYGFRDAWAIGYDAEHTIGVWVGRPDGTPNPGRYGANTAAPLLFQLFDDLPPGAQWRPAKPPGALPLDAKLPPGLRLLGEDFSRGRIAAAGPPPRILYPLDGTVVALSGRAMTLEAEGGHRPLTWIVNGQPLEATRNRWRQNWRPDGVGFNEIVLVDALGRRADARIRLDKIVTGDKIP